MLMGWADSGRVDDRKHQEAEDAIEHLAEEAQRLPRLADVVRLAGRVAVASYRRR
jgi:hypothetical protein